MVTLYRGGHYNLYTYRRWKKDVRLVFAPEESVAFFGGDPDNFNFPRYDLDVSFLRVYEDGKPLQTPDYFRWSEAGAKDGELTFVSGNPGNSSRLLTVAQLAALRDVLIPLKLERLAQLRGWVDQYQQRGAEARRTSRDELFGVENSYKAWFGRRDTLTDPVFFASKVKAEQALRDRIAKDPEHGRGVRRGVGRDRQGHRSRAADGAGDDLDPLGEQVLLGPLRHRPEPRLGHRGAEEAQHRALSASSATPVSRRPSWSRSASRRSTPSWRWSSSPSG